MKVTKISQKMENKSYLSIEKNIIKREKMLHDNFENFVCL